MILEPAKIRAKHALVTLRPADGLIEAAKESKHRLRDRLAGDDPAEPKKIMPVGYVYYRGAQYSAKLYFPSDMLQPLLTMLTTIQVRHVRRR